MSEQLTIRLPEDLSQALEAASVRLRRKRSDVVRLALTHFLGLAPEDERTPSDRVQHLIGSLETGIPDLAENHRRRDFGVYRFDGDRPFRTVPSLP